MYDTKKPVGNGIEAPVAASYDKSKMMDAPLNNDTGLNGTASGANLSAKFKYPRVSEDVPNAGKNQYE